jgi:Na+/proline symporter
MVTPWYTVDFRNGYASRHHLYQLLDKHITMEWAFTVSTSVCLLPWLWSVWLYSYIINTRFEYAYEYLEQRFDQNPFARRNFILISTVRDGIDYLCPCNYLISDTGWNLTYMNIVIGLLVIIYTFSGGTKAVNVTQNSKCLWLCLVKGAMKNAQNDTTFLSR